LICSETGEYIVKKMSQLGAAALVLVMTTGVGAQEKPAPAAQEKPAALPASQRPQVPVKIQLLLSRSQGEKRLSSVPYLMWVTANEPRATALRLGVQVPVFSSGDNTGSYNYKDVGTNIDCSVSTWPDGFYKVNLTIADTSIYFPDRDKAVPPSKTSPPAFRSFTSTFSILLRDGQTGQYTSVTDPVSGEVLKIDATLNVLK
jgi:hypothetical protein